MVLKMINIISRLKKISVKNLFQTIIIMLTVSAALILINCYFPDFFNFTIQKLNQHTWLFRAIRWSMILVLLFCWPILVKAICQRYKIPLEKIAILQQEKYRIALWLILFELLICENLIVKLIHLL